MIPSFSQHSVSAFSCLDCKETLGRLIENISGFVYRRRLDARWTMEFISAGCRDVTGFDPHRFLESQSLAFADLIVRSDRKRVNDLVSTAVQQHRRATVNYRVRAAHGRWVHVEDRLTPVFTAADQIVAIEGVIDRARCHIRHDPVAPAQFRLDGATSHFLPTHSSN